MTLKWVCILVFSTFVFIACEKNDSDVGTGLIGNTITGDTTIIDLIAYNLSNKDSIRSDENVLTEAIIGSFSENIFGTSTAKYTTQVRLLAGNPTFGDTPIIDSVLLSVPLSYNTTDNLTYDSIKLDKNLTDNLDTFKITTHYQLSKTYGNTSSPLKLNVSSISTFLGSINNIYYSNHTVNKETLLGTGTLGKTISGVRYVNGNGVAVTSVNGKTVSTISPSFSIKLSTDYFKNNILGYQGKVELVDNSHFINHIKGLIIEPDASSSNSFLVNFNPSQLSMTMYYTNADGADTDTDRDAATYSFDMGGSFNVRIGLYNFDRSSATMPVLPNSTANLNGDSKLYLQGMGGPSAVIKFDPARIQAIKDSVDKKGWAIVGANLKLFIDNSASSLSKGDINNYPSRIFAYNYENLTTLNSVSNIDYTDLLYPSDIPAYIGLNPYFTFNPAYDTSTSPTYYQINITKSIKDIIEKDSINYPMIVQMGDWVRNVNNGNYPYNKMITTKPYNPFRMVFVGSNVAATDPRRLKLEIIYTKL